MLEGILRVSWKIIMIAVIFSLLTVITQIGGIVYLVAIAINYRFQIGGFRKIFSFVSIYLAFTLILNPLLAPFFGRTPLPVTGFLKPLNIGTVLLNRHYVTPVLHELLIESSQEIAVEFPGTTTYYLDANFPFFDGFAMFPHLSHNDGRKIDLAFYYRNTHSLKYHRRAPSFIGYGVHESPKRGEINFTKKCKDQGFWQYNLITYIVPNWAPNLEVEAERTRLLIKHLANDSQTQKIFVEPHLKTRWRLTRYEKIRFQGCHAVRHDDHIHLQVY